MENNPEFDELVVIGDSAKDIALAEEFNGTSYLYCHEYRIHPDVVSDFKIKDLVHILREV